LVTDLLGSWRVRAVTDLQGVWLIWR
jgi:hypothetical protein